jgi:aldehyde dehydrogenase (NAD+)
MDEKTFLSISAQQKAYFLSGATRNVDQRIEKLKALKESILRHEKDIFDALNSDLRKPAFESYASEIGFLYDEINFALKRIRSWAKPKRAGTPILHFPSSSYIQYEPKGVALIIGAWNYPVQLILNPLIAAVAAGNCAIVKPSEYAPASAAVVEAVIKECFEPQYVTVVQGEGHVVIPMMMLKFRFDHIFYTGGVAVAKKISAEAAKELIPVTLELGGKSPCIIDEHCDIEVAAKRTVWGKFFNAGQTCISPDYVLVHKNIKTEFTGLLLKTLKETYGNDPSYDMDMGRIIDERHFTRLENLLSGASVLYGGKTDKGRLFVQPTLIEFSDLDHPLMSEEIFGPILPVIEFDSIDHAITIVRRHPYPLSLYVFTKNKRFEKRIVTELQFGNGAVNNTLVHYANPNLPFGGVEYSGLGAYHGKSGFEIFSHRKSITRSGTWLDIPIKYPPYAGKLKWLRLFQRP